MRADRVALATPLGLLELVDEAGSDVAYPRRVDFDASGYAPTSDHGVRLAGQPLIRLCAGGGASGIHAHSAVFVHSRLFIAVGDVVACLALDPVAVEWAVEVDDATCFGVHLEPSRDALIAHGELAVSRLDWNGTIRWTCGGADIFTGQLRCLAQHIAVEDFNGDRYEIDYDTGASIHHPAQRGR